MIYQDFDLSIEPSELANARYRVIILVQEFYAALADNYDVEATLSEARKALFAAGNNIE